MNLTRIVCTNFVLLLFLCPKYFQLFSCIIQMARLSWILQIIFQYALLILHTQSQIFNISDPSKTIFTCLNKIAGFYADINTNCKIYHTCDEYGNKFTYHCPQETAFRQDALICDHAHLVHCHQNVTLNAKEETDDWKKKKFPCIVNSVYKNNTAPQEMISQAGAHSKIQYRFALSSQNKIIGSVYPLNNINSTEKSHGTDITNTRMHLPMINQHYKSGINKNENISIQSVTLYPESRLSERQKMKEGGYINLKVNPTLNNILKVASTTFSGSIQNPGNNISNYQSTKASNDISILSFMNYRYHPYLETLKSIQRNRKVSSTTVSTTVKNTLPTATELPVYALTLSLKPLVPNELEYDPYYPKLATSTESFYTSTYYNAKELSYSEPPVQTTWSTIHFELPAVLPDLNCLEDIVDRRKIFYIPRIKLH